MIFAYFAGTAGIRQARPAGRLSDHDLQAFLAVRMDRDS
jgi:hypothetical protein